MCALTLMTFRKCITLSSETFPKGTTQLHLRQTKTQINIHLKVDI